MKNKIISRKFLNLVANYTNKIFSTKTLSSNKAKIVVYKAAILALDRVIPIS